MKILEYIEKNSKKEFKPSKLAWELAIEGGYSAPEAENRAYEQGSYAPENKKAHNILNNLQENGSSVLCRLGEEELQIVIFIDSNWNLFGKKEDLEIEEVTELSPKECIEEIKNNAEGDRRAQELLQNCEEFE